MKEGKKRRAYSSTKLYYLERGFTSEKEQFYNNCNLYTNTQISNGRIFKQMRKAARLSGFLL